MPVSDIMTFNDPDWSRANVISVCMNFILDMWTVLRIFENRVLRRVLGP
jgi:hypothetical protein